MSTDLCLDAALAWCRRLVCRGTSPCTAPFPAAAPPEFPRGIPPLVMPPMNTATPSDPSEDFYHEDPADQVVS